MCGCPNGIRVSLLKKGIPHCKKVKIFTNMVKVAIIFSMQSIINTRQKISMIKYLPMRSGDEIGKNFSW